LAAFEKARDDLAAVGAKVVAASVDPLDKAKEVADQLSFPVVGADGKVRASTYSSGPIGRVEPADVVSLVNFYEKQARK